MSRGQDDDIATTRARTAMDLIKQRGLLRHRSADDNGKMTMYVASSSGDSRAADAEGAPSTNTQGTVGEEVSSGTATPATNNSPPPSASKSTPITNESVMELLKAAMQATRDRSEFGDAEAAKAKKVDQEAAAKAASEDKESSTAPSAAKLIEQLGNSSMSKEDLSRLMAECQSRLQRT